MSKYKNIYITLKQNPYIYNIQIIIVVTLQYSPEIVETYLLGIQTPKFIYTGDKLCCLIEDLWYAESHHVLSVLELFVS